MEQCWLQTIEAVVHHAYRRRVDDVTALLHGICRIHQRLPDIETMLGRAAVQH